MRDRKMTQKDVAIAAGISQATVSRTLRRQPQRSGAAYLKLCSYIQNETVPDEGAPAPFIAALRRTWDGSDRHAAALAALIDASGQLWPGLEYLGEGPSTAQPGSELS